MKILMIHPHDIFGNYEPWTTRIVNIAKCICSKGHEVKLIYFVFDGDERKTYSLKRGFRVKGLSRKTDFFNFVKNIFKIIKLVEWADVVHFQKCFHYTSIPVLLACTIKNKPVHYDWDDWETKIFYYELVPFWNRPVGWFICLLERFIPLLVDTISVSSHTLKELCRSYGVSNSRIYKVNVGADLNIFNPSRNGKLIRQKYNNADRLVLYLGQLHGAQYVDLFLYSIKIILNSNKKRNIKFMVVGGGSQLKKLQQLAGYIGVDKEVIFTGHVAHGEIPFYIAAADVCVAAFEDNDITKSKSPLKIAEYLASGKPIVASDIGEVGNMIGKAGILVEPGDINALATGIVRFLDDFKLRSRKSKEARQRAEERFNWVYSVENLLKAYNTIV